MTKSIDLAGQVRRKKSRRKVIHIKSINPTFVLTRELGKELTALNVSWLDWMVDVLVPAYTQPDDTVFDADQTQLFNLIRQQGADLDNTILYQTERLGKWVTRVGQWHGRRTISAVVSATGVDITPYIDFRDVEQILNQAIQKNVALITGLNDRQRVSTMLVVAESIALRRNKRDFMKALSFAMTISTKRARLIAQDQTSKLVSALNEFRFTQLGFDSYVWRTVGDNRVRHKHMERDGRLFRWSEPPSDGHPGFPINCRCGAEAYMNLGDD